MVGGVLLSFFLLLLLLLFCFFVFVLFLLFFRFFVCLFCLLLLLLFWGAVGKKGIGSQLQNMWLNYRGFRTKAMHNNYIHTSITVYGTRQCGKTNVLS